MLRRKTNAHYAACAAQTQTPVPTYDCDRCGPQMMSIYRSVFANGTIHFASRCRCGHRYWPQTKATKVYWADAPLVPSKKSQRRATDMCSNVRASELMDEECLQAMDRDR